LSVRILRPSDAWCGRLDAQHLSCPFSRNLSDVLHAPPLSRYNEQRALILASEHASEAAAVKVDRL
jgi:hypothetical protein